MLLGAVEVEHVGCHSEQNALTLGVIVIGATRLGVECYRIGVIVIAAFVIGELHIVVRLDTVVAIVTVAGVNVVESGVNIGLVVVTFAGEGNKIACCQYRYIQQKRRERRKHSEYLVGHICL